MGNEHVICKNNPTINEFVIISSCLILTVCLYYMLFVPFSLDTFTKAKGWGAVFMFFFLGLAILLKEIKDVCHDSPEEVRANKSELYFLMRDNTFIRIAWSDVLHIQASVWDRSTVPGKPMKSGAIWCKYGKDRLRFVITYNIAIALQEIRGVVPTRTVLDPIDITQEKKLHIKRIDGEDISDWHLAGMILFLIIGVGMSLPVGLIIMSTGIGSIGQSQFFLVIGLAMLCGSWLSFRVGIRSRKSIEFQDSGIKIYCSVFDRLVKRADFLKKDDIIGLQILRNGSLDISKGVLNGTRFFAVIHVKNGKEYSLGQRSNESIWKISSTVLVDWGKVLIG